MRAEAPHSGHTQLAFLFPGLGSECVDVFDDRFNCDRDEAV